MSKLKVLLVFAICVTAFSQQLVAQSWADAQYALWNEQPAKAKEIVKSLLASNPTHPEYNYRMGNLLYNEGKKDSAKIYYNRGIKPEDKTNYNFAGLGKLALDEGNTTAATEYFTKLTQKEKSSDAKAYLFAGEAYYASSNPQLSKAITTLKKSIDLDNKNVEAYILLGDVYFANKEAGLGVSNYEWAIEKQPNLPIAFTKIGRIYMLSRNYRGALEHFEKANAVDPNFIPVYFELAEFNHYAKKPTESVKFMDEYLKRSGRTDIEALSRYASFVFLSGDYARTITLIEDLLSRDASNVILSRLIGYSYYEQGKYPEGITQMETFFAKVDTSKIIGSDYAYYGKLLTKTDKDSLGIIYLNRALEKDSTDGTLYDDLGTAYMSGKKYLEAAAVYKQKIEKVSPITVQDYFQLGRGYYYGGNIPAADSAFTKVTDNMPNAALGYLWRGRTTSQLDPTSEQGLAFPHYKKFTELATDEVKYKKELIEAYSYLGYYHYLKKETANATASWQKVKNLDPTNTQATEYFKSLK